MAASGAAWGIEIGAAAIKAIRLERDGEKVMVSDFAVIPHKKVLTTPDLDQDEMVRLSLGQFISQKDLENEILVMSVPGHAAFARFAKLPPVEPKKVPDIVKFEAVQQIPFPIEEVEWDYQTFTAEDSPEVEVGIFAITRDRVQKRLGLYSELGLTPESLTLSPVALYNAMAYDLNLEQNRKPVIFLDIGTQASDVVIADEGRCWIRTFPLGGTHFTEAIASAFKLSYSKAEKLKKEAATSKYAKQIMQAMRPVFSDLLQDLQRSIGYYQSLHRENDLQTMVGVGSTFKIPGLRKFIGQQLQIDVVRLDEFKKIAVGGREAASFAESSVNMASAYGLALQGVGLAPITANLVPVKALREQMWHSKTKWFAAAAAIVVAGAATTLYHPLKDRAGLESVIPSDVQRVLSRGDELKSQVQAIQGDAGMGFSGENMRRLTDYRRVWPHIVHDASAAIASSKPQSELIGDDISAIRGIAPGERRLIGLRTLVGDYIAPAEPSAARRIAVELEVEFSHRRKIEFLNETVATWLRENAEPIGERSGVPYRIVADSVRVNPSRLVTVKRTADGEESESGSSGRSSGGRAAPPAPPSGSRGAPPKRGAPGSGIGGGGSGGGSGFGLGGGGDTRRAAPPKRGAPGSGGFGLEGSGGGNPGLSGPSAPRTPSRAPARGSGGSSGSGGTTEEGGLTAQQMADLAPLPSRPSLHEGEATFYRVPITFEVELIDPTKPAPANTASTEEGAAHG